ncbi:MAG: alginate lyase family protein [Gammaproteobacteria bacterium]
MHSVAQYFHTLRYLRPVQVYGRLWFRLRQPKPELRSAPRLREREGVWREPCRRPASMYGPAGFRFLDESHEVCAAGDWNHAQWNKLWLYNLHYFDDLNATGACQRVIWHRDLITWWMRENPPGFGNGWEPYPLSLRIVNWIKWALRENLLESAAVLSLAIQARYLSRRLERHLLGNHLFANAKALVFAGAFFSGKEADAWLRRGLRLLDKEIPEQILNDGGHFERSPMYHSIVSEDLLDLLNLAEAYPSTAPSEIAIWREAAQRMRRWLAAMCHPDGEIALFNDAAVGVACTPASLDAYALRLGLGESVAPEDGITHLAGSGYVRLQMGPAVVLLDVGEIGPDYLPGHAHADTLSFELSLFGQRVLVNSGTSCYGRGSERLRQRGTAAHNTVIINGLDSSEVWGAFRVARRARPVGLSVEQRQEYLRVSCAHNGYRRLQGKPVHWREWVLREHTLTVRDRIKGRFEEAISRFHFHPGLILAPKADNQSGVVSLPAGDALDWQVLTGKGEIGSATYHPRFGVTEENQCLTARFTGPEASVVFRWD